MRIAVVGCLHGKIEEVYQCITDIEEKEKIKVDLLLCCGDIEALRSLSDLKCKAHPKSKGYDMGSFYKYYNGELKAPILTIVIGGNHEASNHFQELPFGGWLCPRVYYLGHCGVVDIIDEPSGEVVLTVGGLSGIYKSYNYFKGTHHCITRL